MTAEPTARPIVVLMDGLGCDSSTIGHLWATRPETRLLPNGERFELEQLVVLTSQTLNEWWHTGYLNETYKYPVFAQQGIRTVQIMRAGPSCSEGYVTLEDTRRPKRCWIRGYQADPAHPLPPLDPRVLDFMSAATLVQQFPALPHHAHGGYGLSDELLRGATIPQFGEARRQCSPKFKHLGQDQWVLDEVLNQGYGLGQELLQRGIVPQYSSKGQLCQNHFKADPLGRWLDRAGLGQELLRSGVVPQYVQGRRRCSHKTKTEPCASWLEILEPPMAPRPTEPERLPTVYVAIGFTLGEERRRQRGDLSEAKRTTKGTPQVKRINFYPLMENLAMARGDTEAYARREIAQGKEDWWRSACVFCPFSGIAGPKEEVLMKHRRYPAESGFALLVEQVARRLNPKQTLYPQGRSLAQMLQEDGNQAALDNLESRLASLPWALYRVQRIVGTAVPWRRVQMLGAGVRGDMERQLRSVGSQLGGQLSDQPDGFWRVWIEQRQASGVRIEDMVTVAPALVQEKHRRGWMKMWGQYHSPQQQLSLL